MIKHTHHWGHSECRVPAPGEEQSKEAQWWRVPPANTLHQTLAATAALLTAGFPTYHHKAAWLAESTHWEWTLFKSVLKALLIGPTVFRAKFYQILRASSRNSAARHRLPLMTENLRELFRNFSYWRLALYYMPMRNYAVRIGPFSLKLCSNINRKSFFSSHKCHETHD